MTTKILEIRDRMTLLYFLCVSLEPEDEWTRRILSHSGYGFQPEIQRRYIVVCSLRGGVNGRAHDDPYEWGDRTYKTAHLYIATNWDTLKTGDVVDVEKIIESQSNQDGEVAA